MQVGEGFGFGDDVAINESLEIKKGRTDDATRCYFFNWTAEESHRQTVASPRQMIPSPNVITKTSSVLSLAIAPTVYTIATSAPISTTA